MNQQTYSTLKKKKMTPLFLYVVNVGKEMMMMVVVGPSDR